MGLFSDLFSTKPAEEAAAAKKAGYVSGYDALTGQYGAGREAVASDYEKARSALTSGTLSANEMLRTGFGSGRDAIERGYTDASALYKPLLDSTTAGAGAYADATGVNGADGIARAGSTFKSLPGYSGGLTTGTDQLMRTAAARGDTGGGNTSADIIKFASDYDANKYGNFVSTLAPYLGLNSNAVAGAAGLDVGRGTALAGNDIGLGTSLAGSYGNLGSNLSTNYARMGDVFDNSYRGQGTAANASFVGQGNAEADAKLAPYSASQNFWSALMGGANLATKAFSGGKSGGGFGLGSLFMGGGSPTGYGS